MLLKNYIRNLTNAHDKLVFVPGKPFQSSLLFGGKARAYKREQTIWCSPLV
jgi:hypothetical protein